MASVIALAITQGVSAAGAIITLSYAVGAATPMLVIGYGARSLSSRFRNLRSRAGTIRQAFGALTVLACALLLLGLQSNVQQLLPTAWSNTLTGFESAPSVQKEIDNLDSKPSLPPADGAMQPLSQARAAATAAPQAAREPASTTPAPTAIPPTPTLTGTSGPAAANTLPDPGSSLRDLGPAPELTGIQGWINSAPLSIRTLRGKVVIVDFWTFECYNCQNTRPYVKALYDKYHAQGLEILGIHTPEFAFERVPENVRNATREQGINWPVALDPDYKTWSAYNNRYWPAFYFIDAQGRIRYEHFGEGNYDYNEKVVQQLLYEAHATQ
jgi:thiol-disulfide isomerase/thioredoxin